MIRFPRALALALSLTALAPLGAGPIEDGEAALREGQYDLALRFFKVAIKSNPDDERAWQGYEAASREVKALPSRPASRPAARPAPQSAQPLATGLVAEEGGFTRPADDLVQQDAFQRYKNGEPIFYSPQFKRLITGRRLKSKRVAEAFYEQQRQIRTRYYQRKNRGRISIGATLMNPELYAYFACLRAADQKMGKDAAIEIWERDASRAFRLIEFFISLENLSYEGGKDARPKLANIEGIENMVFLEDDRGLRYKPYKTSKVRQGQLRDKDSFTVWFAPFDRNGNAVWEGSVSELRLVIEGLPGEAGRIRFPFAKSMFRRMVQAPQAD